MQDRFYALLKRRLRAEIEKEPPLFPWESQLCEYTDEPVESQNSEVAAAFWVPQLVGSLNAVPVPEAMFGHLLERCQAVMQRSLRRGEQLVQVVEELFPTQPAQTLHQIAGWVLAEPVRGTRSTAAETLANTLGTCSYDEAESEQQIALTLLAAQHILNALTLELTSAAPQRRHDWQTQAGLLTLTLTYQPEERILLAQGVLPCEGHLSLESEEGRCDAVSSASGALMVGLCEVAVRQSYRLRVAVDQPDVPPLEFVVRLSAD